MIDSQRIPNLGTIIGRISRWTIAVDASAWKLVGVLLPVSAATLVAIVIGVQACKLGTLR